ncbi:MAG: TAXI family TRAP transporter solute-binding subunit [Rickettsiales bacterium]
MNTRFAVVLASLFALIASIFSAPAQAEEHIITIGTGAITGVYYPAGGAICRLINRGRKEHGIRCFVESTGGSVYNLRALHEGELNFGIVQSDWQYNAYNAKGMFAESAPFRDLRSVFSLHSEMFTVAVARDSGIKSFDGLKGKRVNIGDAGSGLGEIMMSLVTAHGWSKHSFAATTELRPTEAGRALCEGKIDAMMFAAGHPNGLIQDITSNCGAKLIPLVGKEVDELLAKNPFYARTAIPGGMYQGNPQNVPTFGVKATLVTTAQTDDETVYQLVKAVFDNFENFQTLHFVFATLDKDRMVNTGLIAPIHPGALRYYREMGLLKETNDSAAAPRTKLAPASIAADKAVPMTPSPRSNPLRARPGEEMDLQTGE